MDPIADFLTQIRNAYLARQESLTAPASKIKLELAQLLSKAGYIGAVKLEGTPPKQAISVNLVYHDKTPMISHLKRLSRPSVRLYSKATQLPRALSGRGITVISTSKGLMTDREARKAGLGGEIICQLW